MSPVPFGRRDRLTSAVGPDGSGSNPGSACTQSPEKSGMDTALSLPLCSSSTVGATAWPNAGVTTAAAVMNTKGKFRHCESIAFLLLSLRSAVSSRIRLHPLRVRLEDGGVRFCAVFGCRRDAARTHWYSRRPKSAKARNRGECGIVLQHRVDRSKYLNFAIRRHSSAPLTGLVTKRRAWGAAIHAGGHPCQLSLSSTMTAIS